MEPGLRTTLLNTSASIMFPSTIMTIEPQLEKWHVSNQLKIFLCMVYVLIFVFGVLGNASVIYCLSIRVGSVKYGHGFIVALAVTDLLSSVAIPFVMINDLVWDFQWHFGSFCCAILPRLNNVFLFASAWLLVAISIERLR